MNFHVCVLAALTICASAYAQPVAGVGDDAAAMLEEIKRTYAYPERIEEGWARRFRSLADRIDILETRSDLLDFAEEALHRLCDHHAITGPSSQRSAALVPSFADLWIEAADADDYVISQVRQGSPAAHADIRVGDRLLAVNGLPMPKAIDRFWRGEPPQGASCLSYAARVLASGPRNGLRALSLQRDGALFEAELDSLYNTDVERGDGPVSIRRFKDDIVYMRFNNSLGDSATIAAVDAVMLEAPSRTRFVIDLRDTASGGNTSVARAVLGHFTDTVQPYQRHSLPVEARMTGVERSWIEEVSPRGKQARKGVVLVGRWTGSMGEGMAVGFHALGVPIYGSQMAGLLGANFDLKLGASGWIFKLPAERLSHIDGSPREAFVPEPLAEAGYSGPVDQLLEAALARLRL